MDDTTKTSTTDTAGRRDWTSPQLREVGTLAQVVKGGGGKLSIPSDGDGRKGVGFG